MDNAQQRPRLLDTYCGAGGCSMGYHRAGFDVVGVDIAPQKNFPFEFHQGDAIEYIREHGREFDVIHASPPCQAYGLTERLWQMTYPELLEETRKALRATGRPYVIENVPGAPLYSPTVLNGAMFGMLVHRVRLFETMPELPFMLLPQLPPPVKMGRAVKEGDVVQPVGHFSGVDYARKQMDIDWMTRDELAQAIPPAYTEWIGHQLLEVLE